jgi:hypothetical protein
MRSVYSAVTYINTRRLMYHHDFGLGLSGSRDDSIPLCAWARGREVLFLGGSEILNPWGWDICIRFYSKVVVVM